MFEQQGLYHPSFEHDACGVGFIADLKGGPSHSIIQRGLTILRNLEHRGACGCDANTGDGAGILMQLPDGFFRKAAEAANISLPSAGDYGVAMVFLPRKVSEANFCEQAIERIVKGEGQHLLGWRDVPTNNKVIGDSARSCEPVIRQAIIGRAKSVKAGDDFERMLFVIRKQVEHAVLNSTISEKPFFHITSCSCRTIVYKGLLLADQVDKYFPDLADKDMVSALALVHQRYSTNTSPTWELAHPFRYLAHNGEINTLRGNINWMHARQSMFETPLIKDMQRLCPVILPRQSDSACLDNAVELLVQTGRSLTHAIAMLIPEAWENHKAMSDEKKAFYEYHSCLMEPWDGPASIAFTDGRQIGATLDRNGLRPSRYWVTNDDVVIMASETGVLDIPQDQIKLKGRLQPGKMFLCDIEQGRIISDEEVKGELIARQPYREWLDQNLVRLEDIPTPRNFRGFAPETLTARQQCFGYTLEDLKFLIHPMALDGKEPIGAMGNDVALAVLSERPQPLSNYFKQLFAQVTNPPLDAIREELVTSLQTTIGSEGNLLTETKEQCRMLSLEQPILTNQDLEKVRKVKSSLAGGRLKSVTLPTFFARESGAQGLAAALEELFAAADKAIASGVTLLVLTDRDSDSDRVPMPSLLAVAGLHHHLIREGTRTQCDIVLESGEPREVMHFALLCGYGCSAINPYLAFDSIEQMRRDGQLGELTKEEAQHNYIHAINHGLLKCMSKMGISTLRSYRGAQIFEAVGLNSAVIDKYFTWTASRIEGIGLEEIAQETIKRHERAYPAAEIASNMALDAGGHYQWRRGGERHMYNPFSISKLQEAVNTNSAKTFEEFSALIDENSRNLCTLRGLFKFRKSLRPVPLDEVEPAKNIVKRFATGAMSFGSISAEAHETLAIAMNRIGGKSNTGEGGEDAVRYKRDANGDLRNSAIKQVASGRFGVTSHYLVNAQELQIKMAQGAKPGEGGQLPGKKVDKTIARIRHSTAGVQLISPPPHHDIYSIEDLAQLIYDLKNGNREARISVKLVAEVGVGTIAAGVAKAKADVILISGHDGGTGASPLTSIKHAGLPWELGLAEAQQVLVMNDLRSRVVLQTDGQLKTGRDVAIACLLGAEEFGCATAPLIAVGCIMMRKCHLNTCPVGIATQDPILRKRFEGKPEQVINYFFFVAEQLRKIMAELGFRKIEEMVGRVDMLDTADAVDHWKARGLNLAAILHKPQVQRGIETHNTTKQDHALGEVLDMKLIELSKAALDKAEKVEIDLPIRNVNRTAGTILSSEVSRKYGADGLNPDTIHIRFKGSAGQSLGAFGARGIRIDIEGDANDYFGKGLSGARLTVRPAKEAKFKAEENIIIGNTAFYGATSGEGFINGLAGERFAVRNSGAKVVVEGVGDHGCEYMTGGRAMILGKTGRNFAAGMTGGVAYVLDEDGTFPPLCNMEFVALERIEDEDEATFVRTTIENHLKYTGSAVARRVLDNWETMQAKIVKIMPTDYKAALAEMAQEAADEAAEHAAAAGARS